jgi:hypothetical protein
MAQEKPLDLSIVQAWLSAWNERDIFFRCRRSPPPIFDRRPPLPCRRHPGVGREPRSLVFRRMKQMIPVLIPPLPALKPIVYAVHGDDSRWQIRTEKRQGEEGIRWQPPAFPEMIVSPVAPVAPSVGQLWHQTGVKSETVPKSERILRWDGTDWVIAGLVSDSATIMKQGLQVCDFQEALACAHGQTKWLDCEFIYTYDGSTGGNA